MPAKPIVPQETFADIGWPKAGIDISGPFSRQDPKHMPNGEWGKTTPVGINVRTFEPSTNRARGGAREGLSRFINARVGGLAWIVQELAAVAKEVVPVQITSSGRVVVLTAVSQGEVYFALSGDTAWTLATDNTAGPTPLNFTGIVRSAVSNQKLYYADGNNWSVFVPATSSVETWVATAGSLPVDTAGNTPRLICTWRGRTVLSGLLLEPQNVFLSAVNDPTDFDYSPLSTTPTQAVDLNLGPQGLVGDVITSLCPYTDDVLIFFCDHSIFMLNGDPMEGGQLALISDEIGGTWGIPWVKDPYGNVYFVSNRTGIYTLVPGQSPVRISQQIEYLLAGIDTGANTIRLLWNDRFQGLHVFVTQTSQAAAATHFFYETRTGAWWQDQFVQKNYNPLCCCSYDGNLPGDRVGLIGSWDGFVRAVDPLSLTDDGYPITSAVVLGPLSTKNLDTVRFKDLQAVLGALSGQVQFAIYVGTTAEIALASQPVLTGTWTAGRNINNMIRQAAHGLYVKITATNPWAFEQIRARVVGTGKVGARGF